MRRASLCLSLALALVLSTFAGLVPVSAQGQVYTDTMDSAETGLLSTDTWDPSISFTYQGGQFVVNVQQPAYQGDITSTLNVPELASSRLTVDATIAGEPANKYFFAGCRHSDAGEGYFFGYMPATGYLFLWRRDAGGDVDLAQQTDPSLIAPAGTTSQVGIDCWTNIMTGSVNGQPVLSAFDDTYTVGRPTIGVGANGQETDGLSVAFDNLSVTDNGNLALGDVTPVATLEPTTAAAAVEATGEMAPIQDPAVDPGGTLSDAFTVSLEQEPVASELGGDIDVGLDSVQWLAAGSQMSDFYAEFYYTTPSLPANTSYLVGFCFWTDPDGNCYDIYLQDLGAGAATWGYGYDPAVGDYQSIETGDLPPGSVDPTPGATNFLSLTVYRGVAILSGNTFDVGAVISLGETYSGDVKAETGFTATAENVVAGPLSMSVSDFAVWDLSSGMVPVAEEPSAAATEQPAVATLPAAVTAPTSVPAPTTAAVTNAGPTLPPVQGSSGVGLVFDQNRTLAVANPPLAAGLAGSFTQEADVYAFAGADVSLGDFYSIVTFTNPTDVSTLFDIGIGFRADQGVETGLRFVVRSDGAWFLQQPGQTASASGTAASFDPAAGGANVIELLVQGTTGIVAINGVVLPLLDLSAVAPRGDVYVGAGFFQGDTVAGRVISYSDWWIYPTSVLDIPSG